MQAWLVRLCRWSFQGSGQKRRQLQQNLTHKFSLGAGAGSETSSPAPAIFASKQFAAVWELSGGN